MKAVPHTKGEFQAREMPQVLFTPSSDEEHPEEYLIEAPSTKRPYNMQLLATVEVAHCEGGWREAEANARLFAAAPDLLAACKAMVDMQLRQARGPDIKSYRAAWDKVLLAIYKATGASLKSDSVEKIVEDVTEFNGIGPGDTVKHRVSGETWVVLRVNAKYLWPAGWPCTRAPMSDCTLLEKASPEFKAEVIEAHKRLDFGDPRRIP